MRALIIFPLSLALMIFAACVNPKVSVDEPVSTSMSASDTAGSSSESGEVELIEAAEITVIRINHLYQLMQAGELMLIDCRPFLFYRMGHIDGAVSIPEKSFDSRIKDFIPRLEDHLKLSKTVVVYCQNENCPDAHKVAKKLSKRGYAVTIYPAGWEEWKKSGL